MARKKIENKRKNRSIKMTDEEWEIFRKYKLLKIIRTMIEQYKEL